MSKVLDKEIHEIVLLAMDLTQQENWDISQKYTRAIYDTFRIQNIIENREKSKLTELEQENERLRDFHKKATTIATSFSRLDKNTLGYKFYLRHKELTNKTNK